MTKANVNQFPTNQMILMLIKKRQFKSKNGNSHRTLVKGPKANASKEIREINDLIKRVSRVRGHEFTDMTEDFKSIPSFNDQFDVRTEKEYATNK